MQVLAQTENVPIDTDPANVASLADTPAGGVAFALIPSCTDVDAGESVTGQIIRTDTGDVIGATTVFNVGADPATIGPLAVVAPIPHGASAIALQVFGSSAAGDATGDPSAPTTLVTIP